MTGNKRKNKRPLKMPKALPDVGKIVGRRLNILFGIVFFLFLILLGRLYLMQIYNHKFYADELKQSNLQTTITTESPRGQIFDAKGQVLAATTQVPAVTFTRIESITAAQMRKNAIALTPIIKSYVNTSTLTTRNKKDFYLADPENMAAVNKKIPSADLYTKSGTQISASATYTLQLSKVTEADIDNFTEEDLVACAIYELEEGTQLYSTTNLVSSGLTAEQEAQIGSKESQLPGIGIGTAWNHSVDSSSLLAPLLGTISSSKAGLPASEASELIKKGYLLNDRVGTSYLEKGYESYLQGTHEKTQVTVNGSGDIVKRTTLQKGKSGDDLKLTIDSDFENGIQQILQANMAINDSEGYGETNSGIYAVVMNPNTGAILSMNGIDRDPNTGTETNDSLATMIDAYLPGSMVKPGTLTAGWNSGAITGDQIFNDQTIQLAGSAPITSDFNRAGIPMPLDAIQALAYSSNTYMLQVGLAMYGQSYKTGMTVNTTNRVKVFNELRSAYAEYGLGTSTGFDIPGESTGLVPSVNSSTATVANSLFECFGQYDNYTPLQAAQYASALATGKRVAPHIVQGIYAQNPDGSLGKEIEAIPTKVLNTINLNSTDWNVLKQGMQQVTNGTSSNDTGHDIQEGAVVPISAKTGTSTSYTVYKGTTETVTVNNVVAYAPTDNPQIAIAIMSPNNRIINGVWTTMSHLVTREIVNLYGQMYGFK